MSAVPQTTYSEEEYLNLEEKATYKNEYFRGEIFMMAGGTPNHNRIKENLSGEIYSILKKGSVCRSYSSDQRVHIPENSLYTYPDIVVVCEPNQYANQDKNSIINPTVIIEVLSPGSIAYDRGDKFRLYREIESLQEYITISSLNIGVEVFKQIDEGDWALVESKYKLAETLTIRSIETYALAV